jgi:UTP--glucose-1-phosphate uridylyltransferase
MIRKAVIPAAGLGTRFLPITKAQPKEMLPVVHKPVIQYVVEEIYSSGIKEILVITGKQKRSQLKGRNIMELSKVRRLEITFTG